MVTATVPDGAKDNALEIGENGLQAPKTTAGQDNGGVPGHKILSANMPQNDALKAPYKTSLIVNNSITGGKSPFTPTSGNTVNWYGCGPTVYDSAHMGHARNYLTFDILRRIMEDYFGYSVNMVMNITDIDDKIIARAKEQNIEFSALARFWEYDFWRNMQALNCKMPDCITRVSEYIPEIIKFIEKIVENGYAYASGGSVYFDTAAFQNGSAKDSSEKHVYGRMEPWSINNEERVLEGEGALGATQTSEKKCSLDFALWKKAKIDEPSWESPWGPGRPGWHIECSAMAADVLGFPMDVHSGGIDLRFPHHDNELAQTEAHYDRCRWVSHFLHSGHLHIQGLKMSKSLKNFITIAAILENYDPKIVRLLVLMHRWDQPMNYNSGGESMVEPSEVNRSITNFFATMKSVIRKSTKLEETWKSPTDVDMTKVTNLMGTQKWNSELDRNLFVKINLCQTKVHEALSDNFDTPSAIEAIQQLISDCNIYLTQTAAANASPKGPLLIKATAFVHKILRVFGLVSNEDGIYGYLGAEQNAGGDSARFEKVMDTLAEFRHQTREASKALLKKSATIDDARTQAKKMLTICDEIRDLKLPPAGVRLEDQGEKGYMWKEMS